MIDIDPVPSAFAGVYTTACECGWEIVNIVPEENEVRLAAIIHHLEGYHHLKLPLLTVTGY